MFRIILAITIALFSQSYALSETLDTNRAWKEIPLENKKILTLGKHEMSCGYAAILNALSFGNDDDKRVFASLKGEDSQKLTELETKYGNKKSQDAFIKRFDEFGISAQDLLVTYNELRSQHKLAPLKGEYLDRKSKESKTELGMRVHKLLLNSLSNGEPPVIMLRSQVANFEPVKRISIKRKMNSRKFYENSSRWNEVNGHFITVIALPVETNDDGSFSLDYLDSYDGKKHQLFIYLEERDFVAAKGVPKKGASNWIQDYPFLLVAGPSLHLGLGGQPWNERTLIYLHHAIYKD